MVKPAWWLLAAALSAAPGFAQTRSYGYAFVAPGRETGYGALVHAGFGGDWIMHRSGLGVGGEIGGVAGRKSGGSFAVLSANASYHVPVENLKLKPFVTFGGGTITNFLRGDAQVNYGGGVHYWFTDRLGARLELRDHVWFGADRHLVEVRFGLAFR
jgi:hypothetical protein